MTAFTGFVLVYGQRVCSDLIDDLDKLHGGEGFSCSILDGLQDLLLSLVPVADVLTDFRGRILDHWAVTCTEDTPQHRFPLDVSKIFMNECDSVVCNNKEEGHYFKYRQIMVEVYYVFVLLSQMSSYYS